jgi:hypothetical protein
MEKSHFSPDGLLAMMVKSMPDVAIDVLNKCEKKENNKTEYDFFALQTKGGIILKHFHFLIKILGNANYRKLQFKAKQNINLKL